MKKRLSLILPLLLFSASVYGGEIPHAGASADASADESLMSETFSIDEGDWIEIKSYDPQTKTYEIVVIDDPTPQKIWATPESLVQAIHTLNPRSMKIEPTEIVGLNYNTDEALRILFDFEREARRKK